MSKTKQKIQPQNQMEKDLESILQEFSTSGQQSMILSDFIKGKDYGPISLPATAELRIYSGKPVIKTGKIVLYSLVDERLVCFKAMPK